MNSLADLVLFSAIGKIFIYLWMMFPIPESMEKNRILKKLHTCDLCSGFWVFVFLFLVFRIDLLHLLSLPYVRGLGEMVSGGVITFVMHLLSIGWKTKFESFIIE